MLSEEEYNNIIDQLNRPPSEISADTTEKLQKKLKEHEYSIKLTSFDPLPHTCYFVNRRTSQQILNQLVQAASTSNEFIIDTESYCVFKQANKPAIIQLQILLSHNSSIVSLVETGYLPKEDDIVFQLIQQLFKIVFTPEKKIFIFGPKNELYPFIQFQLFSHDRIQNLKVINLQDTFKIYWNTQHPHQVIQSTSSTTCICEKCINKKPTETWSLQDCVAYLLNEYLPKTLSNGNFQVGLDPELFQLNHNEQQHRHRLSTYAKNDCLSMQRLIIRMKEHKFDFNYTPNTSIRIPRKKSKFVIPKFDDDMELTSSDDESPFPSEEQIANQVLSTKKTTTPSITTLGTNRATTPAQELPTPHPPEHAPPTDGSPRYPCERESRRTNESGAEPADQTNVQSEIDVQEQPTNNHPRLDEQQRKRIHNRKCTIKQGKRYYRNELIFNDIYHRFSVKQIKMLLRQQQIPIYIVNSSRCQRTNKITLFVAVRQPELIKTYEEKSRNFFTKQHYDELKNNGTLPYVYQHRQHRQHHERHQHHQRHEHHQHRYHIQSSRHHHHQEQSPSHHYTQSSSRHSSDHHRR